MKYRVKDAAADFGMAPKEISEIVAKYYEKPKSYTQVLNSDELNALFDHITLNNHISSLEVVFAAKPKEQPAPKAEQPKQEAAKQPAKPQQGNQPAKPQQQTNKPQPQANKPQQPVKQIGRAHV